MKKIKNLGVLLLITISGICTSVASTNSTIGPITKPARCICMDVYKPVCIIATGQQFSNACHASCAGYTPSQWFDCSMQ